MQGWSNVFVLLSMVLLDHGLLCSFRYIDYDNGKYTKFATISAIILNIIGILLIFLIRFGIETPLVLNLLYSGVTLVTAVICYIKNFELKKKKKNSK